MEKILFKETEEKEKLLGLTKLFCECGNRLHITNIYYIDKEKTKLRVNYDCCICQWDDKYENDEDNTQYYQTILYKQ